VVNRPWHPPPAHPTPPGGGAAQTLLRGRGVRVPVVLPQPPNFGFFVARLPVLEQPPLHEHPSSGAGTAVLVPRAPHPNPLLDAALLTMLLPASLVPPDPAFLPGGPAGRIELLWRPDPQTGLLLPDHTLQRLWWDRSFLVRNNVTPRALGLPFEAADLAAVAWAALARCPAHQLVRVLAGLAFRADVLGPGSDLERALAELLELPGDLQPRLRGAVSTGSPLLDPRCLRWIIRELAAAQVAGQAAGRSRWEPAILAHEAIARVLFPVTLQANSSAFPFQEVLRAVWLLHEGFQLGDDTTAEADRPMSLVAAYTYGVQQSGGMLRFLDRGRRLLEVDDAHPAVARFSPPPSALREEFTRQTGLTTTQWVHGAAAVAVRYFLWVANARPHLATLDQLMEVELPVRLSASFRNLVDRELVTTLDDLGHAVLAELRRGGGVVYAGLGSVPKHDSRAMRDRPVLRGGDGLLHPLGFGLLLDRIVDLPRYVVERSGRVGGDRLLRNVLGHAFEAYASDRIVELRGRHQVLTEHQLTAVLGPHARRGDAVIGYCGDYVLVEISVQALNRGIAAGDPVSITRRCAGYHAKADQAEAMARRLGELVRAYDLPAVRSWTYLVVTDQALPTSPALADALRRIRPARNPRFVCGVDELELLVDAGHRGWSVPGMVNSWKTGALEQTLAAHLHRQVLSLTPLEDRETTPVTDDWLTGLPTDDPQVA
jgi:hypothetical protein